MSSTAGAPSIEIDEAIWAQLRRMDLDALAQVHDRFYPSIQRYVAFRLGDEFQAREISAAVMGQLVEACAGRRFPGKKLFGELLAQAARLAQDALSRLARREARRTAGATDMRQAQEGIAPEAQQEIKEEVRRALRRLPNEQQHLLALRFACQRELAEAAELLGRPLRETSELQWRALTQLRRDIGAEPIQRKEKAGRNFPLEALESGLEKLAAGEELEEVLAHESQAQESQTQGLRQTQGLHVQGLRQALEAAQALQWLAHPHELSVEALERSREAVLTAASKLARPRQAQPYVAPVQMRQGTIPWPRAESPAGAPPVSLRLTSLVWLLVLFLAGAAAASYYFSARTLPGDVFYPIKLASENLRYGLERDPLQRLALEQEFNAKRIQELQILVEQAQAGKVQRTVQVQFYGPLQVNGLENWSVAGIEVQVRPETGISGRLDNGYAAEVKGSFSPEGRVLAQQVGLRRVEIEGALAKLGEAEWLVAGLHFKITPETRLAGSVDSGSQVHVILLQEQDGQYVATWVEATGD